MLVARQDDDDDDDDTHTLKKTIIKKVTCSTKERVTYTLVEFPETPFCHGWLVTPIDLGNLVPFNVVILFIARYRAKGTCQQLKKELKAMILKKEKKSFIGINQELAKIHDCQGIIFLE